MEYDKLIEYCKNQSITEEQALKMIKLFSIFKHMITTFEEEDVNED